MPWNLVQPGTLRALTNETLLALTHGDAPIPRFFMTGDGHAIPPFAWTEACSDLTVYFQTLIAADRLCLHVEEQQSAITHDSVPERLQGLVDRQRVFGWELSVFDALGPALEICNELAANGNYQSIPPIYEQVVELDRTIVRAHALLWELANPPALFSGRDISWSYREYCKRRLNGAVRNPAIEAQYGAMVFNYRKAIMQVRISGNPFIGRKIQASIDRFPHSTHLITCGDGHILENPLQNYVRIPDNAVGIVDAY
ncbi:hypothetical protein [Pseudomonas sp. NPDC096950]|uniref:hypothetical protein n=1 Tax=Pseudomonas sp. NPDC096950 TaxID=3364485 RepID=UPI00383A9A44